MDVIRWPDVGLAILQGQKIKVNVVRGDIFEGRVTDEVMHIKQVSCTILSYSMRKTCLIVNNTTSFK